jgi:DNA-binding response OmpR family regulator
VTNEYDVIVLDVMLPGPDGIAVCQRLRRDAALATPVIMLTARDRLEDKLAGFDAGADDYLVKPFDLPELVARVEALARRGHADAARYEIGDLVLDAQARQVTRAGRSITLSKSGFAILAVLMRESPRVVARRELERELWGDDPPDSDALRSHLYNLRRAVDRPFGGGMIRTLPGTGYCIRVQDAADS